MISPLNTLNTTTLATLTQTGAFSSQINSISLSQAGECLGSASANALQQLRSGGAAARPEAPSRSFIQRVANSVSGLVLGALLMVGCTFNVAGLGSLDASTSDGDAMADASDGDAGRDAGMSGDGGMDGGMLPAGPALQRPTAGMTLPPTRAYLRWQEGVIPSGRTVAGYQVCSTTGPDAGIDEETECPGSVIVPDLYATLGPLNPNTTYRWKVRTNFDDGSNSLYSGLRTFVTDDSVLAWWRFDEGMGAVASDTTAGANNGTLTSSPAWVAGRSGQALQFNGTNYVLIGDRASLEGMAQVSVETWLKTSSNAATRHIVSKWSAVDRSYALRTSSAGDGRLSFQTFTSGSVVLTSADPFNDNAWHHVIGTYNGVSQQLFVDLMMQASGAQTGSIADTTSEVCVGESCNGGVGTGFGFDGVVDEATVYNRELNSDERTNSYCATQAAGGGSPLPGACQ